MKKEITTLFLTLATAFGFAQDAIPEALPNLVIETKPTIASIEAKVSPRKSFGYVRMGISDSQLPTAHSHQQILPGVGLGYRLVAGSSALDLSASYNRRDFRTDENTQQTFVYTLPKANYLYILSPTKENSFYAGGGFAFAGIKTKQGDEFYGLTPNVAVGYQMRNGALASFIQLDVSQPAVAASQKGDLPKAFAELALGAGF